MITLDVETTGIPGHVDPTLLKIVDIGAVCTVTGRQFSSFVHPTDRVLKFRSTHEAFRVSGLTPELLADAPPEGEVRAAFTTWLDGPWTAYNSSFDYSFLRKWGVPRPAGCVMLRAWRYMQNFCDPDRTSPLRFREGRWLWPKLIDVARWLSDRGHDVPTEQTHRAISDARLAAAVSLALDAEKA